MRDDLKLKAECMLRRAGLSKVPKPALACLCLAAVVLLGFALWRFWPVSGEVATADDFEVVTQTGDAQDTDSSETVTVDVEGAVANPGMYQLAADSRIGDAVEAAGGMTKKAAKGSVNLAEKVQDGQQVVVPRKETSAQSSASSGLGSETASSSGSQSASSGGSSASSSKININTASAEELQALSGVGEAISQRIVDYREANGAFSSVDDLTNVSGIGDARLAAIRDSICV